MTAKNDITGDSIQSKTVTDAYRDGWDLIFGKKHIEQVDEKGTVMNNQQPDNNELSLISSSTETI